MDGDKCLTAVCFHALARRHCLFGLEPAPDWGWVEAGRGEGRVGLHGVSMVVWELVGEVERDWSAERWMLLDCFG